MAIFKSIKKKKLGFWAGDQNNFQFLEPLISEISSKYKVTIFDYNDNVDELKEQLGSVDVAWFEWGNGPIVPASQLESNTPIINRIHRYELYTDTPSHINWRNVDKLLFSSPSMIHKFEDKFHSALDYIEPEYLPIGVNINTFNYHEKRFSKTIVYVGRIHPHKNPSLLLQIMSKLVSKDPEYTLIVVGRFHDELYEEYFYDQIKKLSLDKNIKYYSHMPQDKLSSHIKEADFFIITSIIEGLSQASLEAMACGVTPIICNYYGSDYGYPKEYIYNTVDEAVEKILTYQPKRTSNREYILKNHTLDSTSNRVIEIIEDIA